MKRSKKIQAKLARRFNAHTSRTGESKVQQRWETGGFPKPGSENLHKTHPQGRRR